MLEVGKKYFIRTVTYFHVGEMVAQDEHFIKLTKAAWVADTRRFSEFLKNGKTQSMEVEVFPEDVLVAKGGIIDITEWKHDLFTESV